MLFQSLLNGLGMNSGEIGASTTVQILQKISYLCSQTKFYAFINIQMLGRHAATLGQRKRRHL